jgi:hypothetical protein
MVGPGMFTPWVIYIDELAFCLQMTFFGHVWKPLVSQNIALRCKLVGLLVMHYRGRTIDILIYFWPRYLNQPRLANFRCGRNTVYGKGLIVRARLTADRDTHLARSVTRLARAVKKLIWSMAILTAAWVPFFDDMNAIIFLAPISCFDQVLVEDPNVNRLVRDQILSETLLTPRYRKILSASGHLLFQIHCCSTRT